MSQLSSQQTEEEKISSLQHAFQLFSEEAAQLENTYLQLKQDLQSVNGKLVQKVRELGVTTNYLKNILLHMSQGLIFVNLSGIVTTYNHAAESILGRGTMDVIFHSYQENFSDMEFGFSMEEALAKRLVPPKSLLVSHPKNGGTQELEVDVRLVLKNQTAAAPTTRADDLDFTEGLILLFRDVSEMQRLRRQAERHDRLKELGEMAASVAHEIRNPLGGIKGFASLLQRDLQELPHLQQMAGYIVEGAENLNRLVTNVLNYARPVDLVLETTDLVPLMIDLLYNVRMDPTLSNAIEYSLNVEADSLMIKVDAYRFRSALLNLVVNAVQAMPEGGAICFTLRQEGNHAIVSVTDCGIGIPEENLEKIFSPFFTTKANGSGFGLTEALKIIQSLNGTLEVHSQVGKGTTFTVRLPLALH